MTSAEHEAIAPHLPHLSASASYLFLLVPLCCNKKEIISLTCYTVSIKVVIVNPDLSFLGVTITFVIQVNNYDSAWKTVSFLKTKTHTNKVKSGCNRFEEAGVKNPL